MSELVLSDIAKWYITKCFDDIDDYDRYLKAVKNIEEMANNAIRDSGKIHYIRYYKTHDSPDQEEHHWYRRGIGVCLYGDTIMVFPEAFKTVDK